MELKPGQVTIITNKPSDNEYVLLHLDDFEHILSLANMQMAYKSPNTAHERKLIGN